MSTHKELEILYNDERLNILKMEFIYKSKKSRRYDNK